MQFGSSLILWRCFVFGDTVLSEIYLSKLLKRCLCVFSKSVGLQSNLLRNCLTWNEWYRSTTKVIPSVQRTGCSANCLWGRCCVHSKTFDTKTLVNPKIARSEHLPKKSSALRSLISIWKKKAFCISDLRIPPMSLPRQRCRRLGRSFQDPPQWRAGGQGCDWVHGRRRQSAVALDRLDDAVRPQLPFLRTNEAPWSH